ncbi:hypothetical protein [Cocleimonas flava]|nr:hypothetical protein [Cocleimonas flava]
MNTYSFIVTIFSFAMISIIGTHENTSDISADNLTNTSRYSNIVTIKSILNEKDAFDLFHDEFSATSMLHDQMAINELTEETEIIVELTAQSTKNISELHTVQTVVASSPNRSQKANRNNHRLAFYKQLNAKNESIKSKENRTISDLEKESTAAELTFNFNKPTEVAPSTTSSAALSVTSKSTKQDIKTAAKISKVANVDYWDTVHSIESKQGKLLYRPKNKSRSCTYTTSPCGHHQLTVQALKDIGCKSLQCRKDRLDYAKSLAMSKKLLAKNEKRLKKNGYQNLEDYQRYLIHQQGASGIKVILGANKGEKLLNKTIKKNMANNSPYSYRQLNRMGSRLAANIFLSHWKHKWEEEKKLVAGINLASNQTPNGYNANDDQISVESFSLPLFNENEIQLALNYKF